MKKVFFVAASVMALASCGNNGGSDVKCPADSSSCDSAKKCCEKVCCFNGEWTIVEANGQAIAVDTTDEAASTPTLEFNVAEKLVSGSTGCNNITGSFSCCAESKSLDLSSIGVTKRMCKDMNTESQVLLALSKVKTFDVTADSLMLSDSANVVVAKLARIKK